MNACVKKEGPWTELYYPRDFAIMGRAIHLETQGFEARDVLILTVNPNIPDGDEVARQIADLLNQKYSTENSNV